MYLRTDPVEQAQRGFINENLLILSHQGFGGVRYKMQRWPVSKMTNQDGDYLGTIRS